MRFDEVPNGEREKWKWTVEDWIIHITDLPPETLHEIMEHYRQGRYSPYQPKLTNWQIAHYRAASIAIPSLMMAMELAKEMDR